MKKYIALFYYFYETDVILFDNIKELCSKLGLNKSELKYEIKHKNCQIFKISKEVKLNEII